MHHHSSQCHHQKYLELFYLCMVVYPINRVTFLYCRRKVELRAKWYYFFSLFRFTFYGGGGGWDRARILKFLYDFFFDWLIKNCSCCTAGFFFQPVKKKIIQKLQDS